MTFQEAQALFTGIVDSITVNLTPQQLVQKQNQLRELLGFLPETPEFDPIAKAIAEFSPRLRGQLTLAVVFDIQSRDAGFQETTALLDRVANKANADARTLQFTEPKLIAAAIEDSSAAIKDLCKALKAGDTPVAVAKAESLLVLFEKVKSTIVAG